MLHGVQRFINSMIWFTQWYSQFTVVLWLDSLNWSTSQWSLILVFDRVTRPVQCVCVYGGSRCRVVTIQTTHCDVDVVVAIKSNVSSSSPRLVSSIIAWWWGGEGAARGPRIVRIVYVVLTVCWSPRAYASLTEYAIVYSVMWCRFQLCCVKLLMMLACTTRDADA